MSVEAKIVDGKIGAVNGGPWESVGSCTGKMLVARRVLLMDARIGDGESERCVGDESEGKGD